MEPGVGNTLFVRKYKVQSNNKIVLQ